MKQTPTILALALLLAAAGFTGWALTPDRAQAQAQRNPVPVGRWQVLAARQQDATGNAIPGINDPAARWQAPILIDTATGDTWLLAPSNTSGGSSYQWKKIDR